MTIWGVTSVAPVALPALTLATEPPVPIKIQTEKRLKKKAQPLSSPGNDAYVPPPASETNLDLAKKHFKTGKKFYEKKEYGTALDEFQKSYNLIRILDTQYNIGLCYEKLGAYDKAIAALQLYVEGNPGKEEKEEAEVRIAWIRSQMKPQKKEELTEQAVAVVTPPEEQTPPVKPTQPAETKVAAKRKPMGKIRVPTNETWKMPYSEEPPASPAKVATTTAAEERETRPVLVAPTPPAIDRYIPPAGGDETVGVTAKSSTQRPIPYRTLMWTSFGLSAAGLAAGITGHILTLQTESENEKWRNNLEHRGDIINMGSGKYKYTNLSTESANTSTENEYQNEFNTRKTVAYAGFISSAVFLGLGGAFYWLNRRDVRVVANPNSKGAQVGLELYFK